MKICTTVAKVNKRQDISKSFGFVTRNKLFLIILLSQLHRFHRRSFTFKHCVRWIRIFLLLLLLLCTTHNIFWCTKNISIFISINGKTQKYDSRLFTSVYSFYSEMDFSCINGNENAI